MFGFGDRARVLPWLSYDQRVRGASHGTPAAPEAGNEIDADDFLASRRWAAALLQGSRRAERPRPSGERAAFARMISAFAARDLEMAAHAERLASLVRFFAPLAGLPSKEIEVLAEASRLHDLGKLALEPRLLGKSTPLSPAERRRLRLHPVLGARLLAGYRSPVLRLARLLALSHHEHWDGSGYPQGLVGEEIPLGSRLVSLLDRYDALRSRRPYKDAFSHAESCRVLFEGDHRSRPEHFDPTFLGLFAHHHETLAEAWEGFAGR
ncbi:MAG TPA: HD domain-containing phosphohydrolase [Thermoanaerobaculia bacterium]|nr:HD domain-containing phosphohydrolase [Thermoanaerobaculia bacterium]